MATRKPYRPTDASFTHASEGFIYYKDLGKPHGAILDDYDTTYWASVRTGAENYFSQVDVVKQQNFDGMDEYFLAMGRQEFAKEKRFISEIFRGVVVTDEDDYSKVVKAFSVVLTTKKLFQRILKHLDDPKVMATRKVNIAANFGSYLQTAIRDSMKKIHSDPKIESLITSFAIENRSAANKAYSQIKDIISEYFYTAIDKAIGKALKAASTGRGKNQDGTQVWLDIYNKLNELTELKEEFSRELFSRFGLNGILQELKKIVYEEFNYEEIMIKLHEEIIENNERLEQQQNNNQITGAVSEVISSVAAAIALGNKKQKATIQHTGNKMSTADLVVFINTDSAVEAAMKPVFDGSSSKKETRRRLTEFYHDTLSKFDEGTIVYENIKNYQLRDEMKFRGGENKLTDIGDILNKIGYSRADSFINLVKNTMNGALYSGKDGYREKAATALSKAVAYLLFDDMDTIGDISKGPNVIHVFRLTDTIVPLSYLLISLGKAMKEANKDVSSIVKVKFQFPQYIKYRYPLDEKEKNTVSSQQRWEEQRKETDAKAIVTLTFLNNFKGILAELFPNRR